MNTENKNSNAGRIDLVDYARFAAAIAVVAFHYFFLSAADHHTPGITPIAGFSDVSRYGYLGVEFFFMISGYVIFFSAKNRTASQFAAARAVRLYPAFLVSLLITSATAFLFGNEKDFVYLSQFLTSFTMVPTVFGRSPVDGSYWTLALELCFYTIVLLALIAKMPGKLEVFFRIWPLLIVAASMVGGSKWAIVGGYYSYFAAGALFAMQRSKYSIWSSASLLICFYASLSFTGVWMREALMQVRDANPLVLMAAVTVFYLFFCALHADAVRSIELPGAKLLGAITYPLYLIHQTIGYLIIRHFATEQNKLAVILATTAGMIAFAYVIHVCVERRYALHWRAFFARVIGAPVRKLESQIEKLRVSRMVLTAEDSNV